METYTQDTGEPAPRVSFASSGLLSTQIINGAPFELFLSADQQSVERIPKARFAQPPSVFAKGVLQLAVPASSSLAQNLSIELLRNTLNKARSSESAEFRIAIANPVHAPYGRAAREALEQAGLWPLPPGTLVAAENASQTLQFLRTGAVNAALLPQALIHENSDGLVTTELPSQSYQRVEHIVAIFNTDNSSAASFGQWLLGTAARRVLHQAGLQVD